MRWLNRNEQSAKDQVVGVKSTASVFAVSTNCTDGTKLTCLSKNPVNYARSVQRICLYLV